LIGKDGKSLLNSYCANYRDMFKKNPAKNKAKLLKLMTQCMNQDCVQSLEGGAKEKPGCRFLDENGFCYAYNSAQMWCKDNTNVKGCNDGGNKWAVSPLGNADSQDKTEWKPAENVVILDNGQKTDAKFSCACMKGCSVMGNKKKFRCSDENTKKTGSKDVEMPTEIIRDKGKKDQCACRCGDNWGA